MLSACDDRSVPVRRSPAELKTCTADRDCFVSHACLACGGCYSQDPIAGLGYDCEAVCRVPPHAACACVNRQCERRDREPEVTLDQVNATPCTKDGDCGISPTPCQSGCGHPPIHLASPHYPAFIQAVQRDPCCRPESRCPVTACVQELTVPVCRDGRCELRAP